MIRNQDDKNQGPPLLTMIACMWCGAVFLMLNFSKDHSWAALAKWGLYSDNAILHGAYWAQITSAFVHIEPLHLIFNVYWLFILGGAFERLMGPLRWVVFVVLAAFISSGIQFASGTSGIGLSGVGYALFGFGWIARVRYPEYRRLVHDGVVKLFIGWGILCVFLTYAHIMNIANIAHAAGLAFGAAVAAMIVYPEKRLFVGFGLVALAAASIVPLYWNPLSPDWVADQAVKANLTGDYTRAIQMYQGYIDKGEDKAWAWEGLAEIYGFKKDKAHYKEAIEQLSRIDPESADQVIKKYGKPE